MSEQRQNKLLRTF